MSERDDGRSSGDDRGTSPGGDPLGDEPLGDLARRVRERRERGADAGGDGGTSDRPEDGGIDSEHGDQGDTFADRAGVEDLRSVGSDPDDAEALFEEMNVAEVDPDRVWESVLDEADDASLRDVSGSGATDEVDPGSELEEAPDDTDDVDDGADESHLVRKRAYCESCQYFTAPPEVACTYDGGEIVEVVDSDRFRVRNCPVVAGRIDTDGVALGDDSPSTTSSD
ncbi:hypothetical protein [Salinigranum sp. GCM10025319]|uniref:hypothetical protein n=1 Tax=Salinigranum sp. GCM10025319 TaxID=3252687 RepID=UPI00360ECAD3